MVTQSFKKTSVAVTGIVVIFFEFQGTSRQAGENEPEHLIAKGS
jgi:hypothetical protein